MANKITGIGLSNGKMLITQNGIVRDITIADFLQEIIDTANLVPDAVDGTIIADDAVDSEHIADEAVDSEHIARNAIMERHLEDGLALELAMLWTGEMELKELRANEKHGYANVEER